MVRSPNHPCTHRGNDAHFVTMTETGVQVIAETPEARPSASSPASAKDWSPGPLFHQEEGRPPKRPPFSRECLTFC